MLSIVIVSWSLMLLVIYSNLSYESNLINSLQRHSLVSYCWCKALLYCTLPVGIDVFAPVLSHWTIVDMHSWCTCPTFSNVLVLCFQKIEHFCSIHSSVQLLVCETPAANARLYYTTLYQLLLTFYISILNINMCWNEEASIHTFTSLFHNMCILTGNHNGT